MSCGPIARCRASRWKRFRGSRHAGREEVSLGPGRAVLEDAHDEAGLTNARGFGRAPPGEVRDQLADVRYRDLGGMIFPTVSCRWPSAPAEAVSSHAERTRRSHSGRHFRSVIKTT
jgi:hypothetical protein